MAENQIPVNALVNYGALRAERAQMKAFVQALVDAANGDITTLTSLVNTLIGSDSGKSARTIANEEMAAVLLVDPATGEKNFQTLQALAAYLEDHPEEVADILAKIKGINDKLGELPTGEGAPATFAAWIQKVIADVAANATAVSTEETRAKDAEKALSDRLDIIEGEGAGSIKKAQADAAEDATTKVNTLKDTAVSSESGENGIKATLGGTVGAPTIALEYSVVTAADIDAEWAADEAENA